MFLSENEIKIIVDYMVKKFNPVFIYLFGSYAKGKARVDSDIDLAFYVSQEVDAFVLFEAAGELGYLVKRDVQLINIKEASTVFTAQIVGTRQDLYCVDQHEMERFNMIALKKYAKLNEERQVILDRVKEDGKIYG
jgi:predicted nucleotidyltransferase